MNSHVLTILDRKDSKQQQRLSNRISSICTQTLHLFSSSQRNNGIEPQATKRTVDVRKEYSLV